MSDFIKGIKFIERLLSDDKEEVYPPGGYIDSDDEDMWEVIPESLRKVLEEGDYVEVSGGES